jgi:aryl-alcohol dehydrogenase-like predicted oxidoreductase
MYGRQPRSIRYAFTQGVSKSRLYRIPLPPNAITLWHNPPGRRAGEALRRHKKEATMEARKLGNSGITVAPLAFGGNVFGWTADETVSFRLLDAFVDAGFNLIDTADVYSHWAPGNRGGESETIIGKWLHSSGKRDRVVIATKVGKEMGPDRKGLSAAYIRQAVEDSLRRLQTDTIDLYQSHAYDPDIPLEETMEAFDRLIKEGKIRALGASNHNAAQLAQALAVSDRLGLPRYQSLQPLYNLYDRSDFETALAPLCRNEGLGVISYFSLASGFLTGKYRSPEDLAGRARAEMVRKYLNPRGQRIISALEDVARQRNLTPTTVALAWLLAQPAVTAPIASATDLEQLQTLIEATAVRLGDAEINKLNEASAPDTSS